MSRIVTSLEQRIGRRELLLALGSSLFAGALPGRKMEAPLRSKLDDILDELLPGWPESSRAIVRTSLLGPASAGHIGADKVEAIAEKQSWAIENVMIELLPVARHYSRPPLSSFHVGAVARGASGALYLGANLEVAGNALNQAVHAEQSAIANAFAHREQGIVAIAVTAAPCGHCRQFLNEITRGSEIRVIVKGQSSRTLAELLPASFGPEDLGLTAGMFNRPAAPIHLVSETRAGLATAALEAASRAYAPYTKALAGCSLSTESGREFAGSYLENAAFNPSLSPLQSALVNAVFAGEELGTIRRAVLVELRGAAISQRPATEAVLGAVAPRARLDVLLADR